MKTKKGQLGIFALILIIFLVGFLYSINNTENTRLNKCKQDCNSYGLTFVDYEMGYYSNEECWCRKGNEPVRIY